MVVKLSMVNFFQIGFYILFSFSSWEDLLDRIMEGILSVVYNIVTTVHKLPIVA